MNTSVLIKMMVKIISFLSIVLLLMNDVKSQSTCTTIGQTPSTAFPICGTTIFSQKTVPECVNKQLPAGNCGYYPDTNPFWYQFTCYKSGTLGFLITPNNLDDDYDWELFDITNRNPVNVYDSSSRSEEHTSELQSRRELV